MTLQKPFDDRNVTMEFQVPGIPVKYISAILDWIDDSLHFPEFTVKYDFCPHYCCHCAGENNANLCHNTERREYFKVAAGFHREDALMSEEEMDYWRHRENDYQNWNEELWKSVLKALDLKCSEIAASPNANYD